MASLFGTPAAYSIAFSSQSQLINRRVAHEVPYLCPRKVMAVGESRRILVQRRLAIPHRTIRQVREIEEARLFRLALLFEIAWIHSRQADQ